MRRLREPTVSSTTTSSEPFSNSKTPRSPNDGFRSLGGRLDRVLAINSLAQWWTQASDQARFELLQRVVGSKTPQEGDPSFKTLQLAIYLAEAEAGQVEAG